MAHKLLSAPPGYKLIFRRWKIDPKTNKRIYPKTGKVFPMVVKDDDRDDS